MTQIIAVTNQKGGVGKTTTSAALVCGLHQRGARVLGVDLDPQGNLGFNLGLDIGTGSTVYDVLKGACSLEQAIVSTEYGDVLPSDIMLSAAEVEFTVPRREFMLSDQLSTVRSQYDFVIRSTYNPQLKVLGILLNKFNGRLTLSKDILELAEEVAGQLGSKVFQTRIHRGVGVAMAPAHGQTVLTYQPDSRPAQDFLDIVDAVAGDRFPRPKPTFRQKYISKFFN